MEFIGNIFEKLFELIFSLIGSFIRLVFGFFPWWGKLVIILIIISLLINVLTPIIRFGKDTYKNVKDITEKRMIKEM